MTEAVKPYAGVALFYLESERGDTYEYPVNIEWPDTVEKQLEKRPRTIRVMDNHRQKTLWHRPLKEDPSP